MSLATSTAAPRTAWIVSPLWDLAYLVATPLVIVPAVLILARYWFTPEQITIAVISFASMGHHLPGFMRAYGDRELFARFRARFLLMPVLILATALFFSPPSWLAAPLGLTWHHLHGLELILLLWGTWHGLMQTYGFMRIYDLKRGIRDRWTARLDHWLCLAIFGCGYLFSDARMYGTAEVMWQVGLPVFDRGVLETIRLAAGGTFLAVLALYAANVWRQERTGGASWTKILLAASTGWIYWYTGRLSTNLIIGLAMFEIYHAVQYNAIVWHYNRRIVQRDGDRFGWLAFLFRDRWTMLGMYLALIGAFGCIRFFTVDTADYVFRGGELDAHKLLIALLVTSTFLHYYFDGFIWKVSEDRTQRNLLNNVSGQLDPSVGSGRAPAVPPRITPAAVHAAKCTFFFAVAGLFLAMEANIDSASARRTYVNELAALTPDLPELQIQLSRDALTRGDADRAVRAARSALALRPRSHSAHGDLAVALMAVGEYAEAVEQLEHAIALEPDEWRYHTNLGLAYEQLQRPADAERALRRAVSLEPAHPVPYRRLAAWLLRAGRPGEAARQFARACQYADNPFPIRLEQTEALVRAGEPGEAARWAERLCRERPSSADAHVALGTALLADAQTEPALVALRRAVELKPEQAGAWFQLGTALYQSGDYGAAQSAYARVLECQPEHVDALANLGAVLLAQGDLAGSESRLRQALALRPDFAAARLNLGVCLLRQGWKEAAAEQIGQAQAEGQPVPMDLLREVGR